MAEKVLLTSADVENQLVNLDPVRERTDDENFPTITSSEQVSERFTNLVISSL